MLRIIHGYSQRQPVMLPPIPIPQAFALLYLGALANCWQYSFPNAWSEQWPEAWQWTPTGDGSCTTSHLTAFEMVRDGEAISLSTSPLDDFEAPRILPLNSTVTEQWEFDAVSDDG